MKLILALILILFAVPASAQSIVGTPIFPVTSTAVEASHVLKASRGYLYGFSATSGASAGYVMLFDASSAPSNGAVTPLYCYQLPATSTISVNYNPTELSYSNGMVIEFSTTGCFTATSSSTAFFSAQVR